MASRGLGVCACEEQLLERPPSQGALVHASQPRRSLHRPFGTAARNVIRPGTGSLGFLPTTDVDDQDDESFAREVRASIKSRGRAAESRTSKPSHSSVSNKPEVWKLDEEEAQPLPPSRGGLRSSHGMSLAHQSAAGTSRQILGSGLHIARSAETSIGHEAPESWSQSETNFLNGFSAAEKARLQHLDQIQEKAQINAKARASALFEDLISFLELHRLPGAYALALSANGVEDLTHLLMLEDEDLNRVITNSDLDAMDEILLRDALRGVRVR
eukprot:TRINITY_DN12650_c0_g8_i1.p1 TRINITY_DN12650_c0_g8~~TRINITY_DN12650_c0_g8_i1.p1  ORF type:complete len:272 (+),score=46.83 TRINITY_DN12650_c0_g8_i1:82-897(+)